MSTQTLDVDPTTIATYGYPGDAIAVHTGRPTSSPKEGYVSQAVSFDLTGLIHYAALVKRIRAVIDQRLPAPTGTLMYVVPQGDALKGKFAVDLAGADPDAVVVDDNGHPTEDRYTDLHTITIGDHESVGFRGLVLAPPNSDIRYHFEVVFDSGKTARIDDGGKPFRIVSLPTKPTRVLIPTSLTNGGPTGLYECQWKTQCDESYNSVLKPAPGP